MHHLFIAELEGMRFNPKLKGLAQKQMLSTFEQMTKENGEQLRDLKKLLIEGSFYWDQFNICLSAEAEGLHIPVSRGGPVQ